MMGDGTYELKIGAIQRRNQFAPDWHHSFYRGRLFARVPTTAPAGVWTQSGRLWVRAISTSLYANGVLQTNLSVGIPLPRALPRSGLLGSFRDSVLP